MYVAAALSYVLFLALLTRVSPSVTYRNVERIVAGDVRGGCSTLRDAAGTADTCLSLGDVS